VKLLFALFLANTVCGVDQTAPPVMPPFAAPCPACAAFDRFYDARGNRLAWTGRRETADYDALVDAVRRAADHGLDPADYSLAVLEAGQPRRADRMLDETATRAWLDLAHDLARGRLDPRRIERGWTLPQRDIDLAAALTEALETGTVAARLSALAPQDEAYERLQHALANYRAVRDKGAWPVVEPGPALHPGDRGPRVAQLRARLEATGAVTRQVPAADRDLFDDDIAAAVIRLQARAHLDGDGIVGPDVVDWLNTPSDARVWQIAANLERRRWRPANSSPRSLRVNIPDFALDVLEAGEVVDRHRVIVGRRSRPTPVFSAEMAYFILNPWWETPHSLAVRDELPAFRRDPGTVERLGFQILDRDGNVVDASTIDWDLVSARDFPYRLRQAPGPQNALGVVKFIFPNPHNTYLHDTPARHLFDENRRAFSSGCMRVDQPVDLAYWVAAGLSDWPAKRINAVIASQAETRVDLEARIPVHVVYWTAVPEEPSGIRFVDDLYNKDSFIMNELSGGGSADQE
jgi:murein L,D-transpeptidase YcbB/YkuD